MPSLPGLACLIIPCGMISRRKEGKNEEKEEEGWKIIAFDKGEYEEKNLFCFGSRVISFQPRLSLYPLRNKKKKENKEEGGDEWRERGKAIEK